MPRGLKLCFVLVLFVLLRRWYLWLACRVNNAINAIRCHIWWPREATKIANVVVVVTCWSWWAQCAETIGARAIDKCAAYLHIVCWTGATVRRINELTAVNFQRWRRRWRIVLAVRWSALHATDSVIQRRCEQTVCGSDISDEFRSAVWLPFHRWDSAWNEWV